MKNLGKSEDIQDTSAALEGGGQSLFLSIPDSKTPWRLLELNYSNFFSHWYEGQQGRRSVVCAGGVDGKGFDTENCPICEHTLELYQEGKRLRDVEGKTDAGNRLKDRANNIRGKFTAVLKVIRGQYVLIKDAKGRKVTEADFELDPDNVDSTVEVGYLSLSEAQWLGLTGLINGEHSSFITDGADLGKHVLFTKKERRKGKTTKYTAVVWGAEEEEVEFPNIDIPNEIAEKNLDDFSTIDFDEVSKVAAFLTGQDSEDVEDDELVELEGDSEDLDESYLDDIEDDDDIDEKLDDPADFEDDIPDDPPKKPKSKSGSFVRPPSSSAKRSGRRRM